MTALQIAVLLGAIRFAAANDASVLPTASPATADQSPVAVHQGELEGLEAWVNVRVIQKLVHHTTGVIAAVVLFWLAGFLIQRLLHDSIVKRLVIWLDEFVLLGLFVYFAYELFVYLLAELPHI